MRWYVADKGFVDYLHSIDPKVERIDYGNRFKPYFGVVLCINGINYYIPVSSPKDKHRTMKNSKDFLKIHDKNTEELIAVLNINNMIPIPSKYIKELDYEQVHLYRTFESELAKSQYIDLLRKELKAINSLSEKIQSNAIYLYKHYKKFPYDQLSSRCCNFILMEEKAQEYTVEG